MKYLFLLILLVSFVIPTFAQEEITLDTIIEVRSGDTVRTMTVQEALDEFDAYVNTLDYAYKTEDGVLVIPMSPEYLAIAKEQKELGSYYEEIEDRGGNLSYPYNLTYGDEQKFAAYFDSVISLYGDETSRQLHAHAYAGVSIFGIKCNILALDVDAKNQDYGLKGSASLKVLTQTIWSAEANLQFGFSKDYSETLFDIKVPYGPGFTASVEVSLTAEMGVNGGINLSDRDLGLTGTIEPYVEVGTTILACPLDFIVLKIGVECTLNLMRYKLPITACAYWTPETKKLGGYLSIAIELETLDGQLDFVAELFGVIELVRYEIFKWAPLVQKELLYFKKLKF